MRTLYLSFAFSLLFAAACGDGEETFDEACAFEGAWTLSYQAEGHDCALADETLRRSRAEDGQWVVEYLGALEGEGSTVTFAASSFDSQSCAFEYEGSISWKGGEGQRSEHRGLHLVVEGEAAVGSLERVAAQGCGDDEPRSYSVSARREH